MIAAALAATVLPPAIRASATVAAVPVGLAGLLGLRGRRRLRRGLGLGRRASPAVPVRTTAATVTAIAAITTRLAALLLALPTALTFTTLTATATVAAAAITARAILPLLALGDHRPGGSGFRRHAAQQRQGHGGRDQTLHFVLQGALCAAPALSLDSNIGCRG